MIAARIYRYEDQDVPWVKVLFQRMLLERCADAWRSIAWEMCPTVKA